MVSGLALRVPAVSARAAVFGYPVGHIGRSTAGAVGLGLGYVAALENVVGTNFTPLRPWTMFRDASEFVEGQFEAGGDVPGRSTREAGVVLLAYAFGVTIVALASAPATRPDRQPFSSRVEHPKQTHVKPPKPDPAAPPTRETVPTSASPSRTPERCHRLGPALPIGRSVRRQRRLRRARSRRSARRQRGSLVDVM